MTGFDVFTTTMETRDATKCGASLSMHDGLWELAGVLESWGGREGLRAGW